MWMKKYLEKQYHDNREKCDQSNIWLFCENMLKSQNFDIALYLCKKKKERSSHRVAFNSSQYNLCLENVIFIDTPCNIYKYIYI